MIKLLELPTLQLEQRVKQEIEENPVLEEEQQTAEESTEDNGMPKEVSMEEYLKEAETPAYKSYVNNYSRDDKARQVVLFEGMSMHEYLTEQLSYREMPPGTVRNSPLHHRQHNNDGYLRLNLQSISDDIAFNYGKEIDIPELEEGLRVVQSLEPPGGARDIRECLLLAVGAPQQSDCCPGAGQTDSGELFHGVYQETFREDNGASRNKRGAVPCRHRGDTAPFAQAGQPLQRGGTSPRPT